MRRFRLPAEVRFLASRGPISWRDQYLPSCTDMMANPLS